VAEPFLKVFWLFVSLITLASRNDLAFEGKYTIFALGQSSEVNHGQSMSTVETHHIYSGWDRLSSKVLK
jgi:hypothetical protein